MNTGGNDGNNVGSVQGHELNSHTHTQNAHTHTIAMAGSGFGAAFSVNQVGGATVGGFNSPAASSVAATNQNTGGNETRPINANVNYIIKV
jgi:hypothetical protein